MVQERAGFCLKLYHSLQLIHWNTAGNSDKNQLCKSEEVLDVFYLCCFKHSVLKFDVFCFQCSKSSYFEKIPRAEYCGSAQDHPPVPGLAWAATLLPPTLCAFPPGTSSLSERFYKVSNYLGKSQPYDLLSYSCVPPGMYIGENRNFWFFQDLRSNFQASRHILCTS